MILGTCLLECYTAAYPLVELHVSPPRFAVEIGERPVASPLARLQAAAGRQVTNLRHESVELSELSRQVLRHLDGHHDRAAVLDGLAGLVAQGSLLAQQNGHPIKDPDRVQGILGGALDENLRELARGALLVA